MNSKTLKRLLGSFMVVGVAAAMAGLGTFATFTSSTTASHTILWHGFDRAWSHRFGPSPHGRRL